MAQIWSFIAKWMCFWNGCLELPGECWSSTLFALFCRIKPYNCSFPVMYCSASRTRPGDLSLFYGTDPRQLSSTGSRHQCHGQESLYFETCKDGGRQRSTPHILFASLTSLLGPLEMCTDGTGELAVSVLKEPQGGL